MDLAERLKKVNEEINYKFGTEGYEIRCKIFDIHKELEVVLKESISKEKLKTMLTKISEADIEEYSFPTQVMIENIAEQEGINIKKGESDF